MTKQVLLLNQDNTPLNIITVAKAFKLLSKDKVWVDESAKDYYEVVSVSKIVKIPKILILKYYIKLPYKKVSPNRKNIFKAWACLIKQFYPYTQRNDHLPRNFHIQKIFIFNYGHFYVKQVYRNMYLQS